MDGSELAAVDRDGNGVPLTTTGEQAGHDLLDSDVLDSDASLRPLLPISGLQG